MAEELTPAQQDILTAVALFTYATIDQIMKHLGQDALDKNQVRNTQIKLKALVDREYIARIDREHTAGKGKLKPAYRILTAGQRVLRSLGIEAALYDKPSAGHLNHVLVINDVLLLALECARTQETIEIERLTHDYELKTMQLTVIPDAFIHFVVRKRESSLSYPLLIEVDRGTESLTVIEKKIEGYLEFMKEEYRRQFKLTSATVVWFVTGDIKRLYNIRGAIENVLTKKNLTRLGEFFYLGKLNGETAPLVFLEPFFFLPFSGEARFALLDLSSDQ